MRDSTTAITILGSSISLLSVAEVCGKIEEWINANSTRCHRVVVTGFHGIWEAHRYPDFKAILNSADLWVPDGIAPVWIARIKGLRGAAAGHLAG